MTAGGVPPGAYVVQMSAPTGAGMPGGYPVAAPAAVPGGYPGAAPVAAPAGAVTAPPPAYPAVAGTSAGAPVPTK